MRNKEKRAIGKTDHTENTKISASQAKNQKIQAHGNKMYEREEEIRTSGRYGSKERTMSGPKS